GLVTRRVRRRARRVAPYATAMAMVSAAAVPISVALAAAVGGGAMLLRRRRRIARQHGVEGSPAVESSLGVLVGAMRAGAHPVAALRVAATEAKGTVGEAFRAVTARALLGAEVSTGLRSAANTSARPEYWERLAVYWELAHTHGLPVATLMHAAQRDI